MECTLLNVPSGSFHLPGKFAERENSPVLTFNGIALLAGYGTEK